MIAASREAQMGNAGEFAEGRSAYMRGDDGPDAEAAGIIEADTIIMLNKWLRSKFK